ncbi:hypothetical protein pdam_00008099, partial [Pocillopora damicornis]
CPQQLHHFTQEAIQSNDEHWVSPDKQNSSSYHIRAEDARTSDIRPGWLQSSHHCVVFLGKIFYSNRMSSALERECVHQTVWDSLQNAKEEQTRMYKYFIQDIGQLFFCVDLLQTYIVKPPDTAHYQSWINNGLPSQTLKHTQKRMFNMSEKKETKFKMAPVLESADKLNIRRASQVTAH